MIRHLTRIFVFGLSLALGAGALDAAPSDSSTKKRSTNSSATAKKKSTSSSSATKKRQTPAPEPAWRPVVTAEPPVTNAAAVMLVDASSGRTLYQKNADARRSAASTQKLLTALIIAEAGDLDKPLVFQVEDSYAEPVMLFAKPGDTYTRRQLLEALMVKSFNDVARALARDNAGSVELFAEKMNEKAAELGMTSSRFVNPNGLTEPGQYSTARDMSRLARAVYRNQTLRGIYSIKVLNFRYASGKVVQLKNTNQVLRGWAPCNGMKTGYTMAAGHCLVSSAAMDGRDVISVVMGDDRRVWKDSTSLLAWGLSR